MSGTLCGLRLKRARAAIGAVSLACMLGAQTASALPQLGHDGRWLIDRQGRVVLLHGVVVDKFMPGTTVEGWIDLTPLNVRFIAAEGFNSARVSFAYAGYEPQLGQFDSSYLERYQRFDRELSSAGVYDLLNLMQGEYSTVVGGDGFPAWMTDTNGLPNDRQPFPRGYLDNPAENAAWDNLWANTPAGDGVGLQDHYASGLARIAHTLADAPGLLGLELLNEPWPGSRWPSCANPNGCPPGGFDQTSLTGFYRHVIPAIRSSGFRRLIVYEPNLLFDFGAATQLGDLHDPGLLFAFHNYCLAEMPGEPAVPDPNGDCSIDENMVFDNAQARSAATGDALLMDEWGNNTDVALVQRMENEADQHLDGWTVWAYEDCCGSPAAIVKRGDIAPTAPGNLNLAELDALVRPYPQLIAGTPSSWSYDPNSGRFTLAYATRPVDGGSFPAGTDTQVELPALRYPTGYTVKVSGARIVSAPDANRLLLRNRPGAGAVTLLVKPAHHHPAAPGPFAWPAHATDIAAADCPAQLRAVIPIRDGGRGVSIVRVTVYLDGQRIQTIRGRRLLAVTLPAGLADGSAIKLTGAAAEGEHYATIRHLRGCALSPSHAWNL